jgi:predicted ATPase
MNIQSFIYKDNAVEWQLEPITFKPLTLLVGASGVGKTRILQAILNLKKIVKGASLNGIEWNIKFSTRLSHYEWQGCFENKGFYPEPTDDSFFDNINLPRIENEKLVINEQVIIERNADGICFNGVKTVKLPQTKSVIYLLKEEEQIKAVFDEFVKIIEENNNRDNAETFAVTTLNGELEVLLKKYPSLDSIRNSFESLKVKLYLSYQNEKEVFEKIKNAFLDIFPYVKNIKMELVEFNDKNLSPRFREALFFQIKEKGVNHWIDDRSISSGMYRALMLISELYLCADGTLILIDEFENSLGINCIEEVTRSIVSHQRNLQFIITSHHPYIINHINFANWKLITRKAGIVKGTDATTFNLGKSKHQAFTQLINLDEYIEGVCE